MKVAAAVLTFNPVRNGRLGLLADALRTLKAEADEVYLIDNGSTDGFDWKVSYRNTGASTTSAAGTNLQARVLAATDADVCVLSDDDMCWAPGWRTRLEAWWLAAPDDVWLTGCHIEPDFPWNTIDDDAVTFGGVRGLWRQSTGAASWSYRRTRHHDIFPIPQALQGHGDVPACERIRSEGGRIAQIDLATHAGHGCSTWGNRTVELYGWDTGPALERLGGR